MLITLSEAVAKKPGVLEKRLSDRLKKNNEANVTLEGLFEAADGRRWGHQLCCRFRLEVHRVISLQ
jgi:hypothetical protein